MYMACVSYYTISTILFQIYPLVTLSFHYFYNLNLVTNLMEYIIISDTY